jgi:hypothetical protein
LESDVSKLHHKIDAVLSPHFDKNTHMIMELKKDIEKSILVRQFKAQVSYDVRHL